MKFFLFLIVSFALFSCSSNETSNSETDTTVLAEDTPVDALDTTGGKGVFFTELKDSQEVKSPVMVKMGVNGMELEKAGVINSLKGHHHIIIDGPVTPEGEPVINDATHLHYGLAQTEAEIKLTPGYHSLTLQFANGVHASYGPRWSRTVTVKVK